MKIVIRRSNSKWPIGFDWSGPGLVASTDSITTSTWTAETGIAIITASKTANTTAAILTTDEPGDYVISNYIETADGFHDTYSVVLRVR